MAQNEIKIIVTATGAEQAAKVLADVAKSGAQLGGVTATGARQAAVALDGLGTSARRVFEIFTGINLATVFQQATVAIRDFVVESSKLGREQQLQEATFKSFAASVGVAGDALATEIEKVAGGIIDSGDAMKIAMRGLSAGLQPEQIVKLTDAARQLAKSLGVDAVEAYKELTEAIASGRSRRLEGIGITIDQDAALKKYAASINKTVEELDTAGRSQATYLAFLEKAGPVIESNRKVNDEFGESMQRLKVAWQDVQEAAGVFINDTALKVLKWLTQVKEDIGDIGPRLTELGTIWATTWNNAAAAIAPLAAADGGLFRIKTFVNNATLAIGEAAAIINMQILIFTKWTGAIHLTALALKDLASGSLPDLAAHTATVTKRVEDAQQAYDDSQAALKRLVAGFGETSTAVTTLGEKTDMGRNKLGEFGNQVKTLTPDLKALAAEAQKAALAMMKLTLGDAEASLREAQLLLDLKGVDDQLKALSVTLGANADSVQKDADAWREEAAAAELAAEALKQIAPLAETLQSSFDTGLTDGLIAANRELRALQATSDLDADAIRKFGVSFALLDEETQASLTSLRDWRAQAEGISGSKKFEETLAGINQQARLLGPSFDTLAPTISAVTNEIIRLGKAGEDVTALQEKLAGLKQVQELKGIFYDAFGSIGSTVNTSVQGMILGTTTLAKAWDNLWRNIVASFINSGIQRLLKGLTDWAWDFVGSLFGGGGGGGGGGFIGSLVSGAGALLAKFSGAGAAGIGPGTFTDPTGALVDVADAASGTASALNVANKGITNFQAGLGAATSALGIGVGIYGLTKGGSAGSMALSAGGTALSVYGLAQSVSVLAANAGIIGTALPTIGVLIAKGFAAVAPSIAASIGTTLSGVLPTAISAALTGTTAATAATGAGLGAGAGAASAASWLANPGMVMGGMMLMGGLMGKQADAEASARAFGEAAGAVRAITTQMGAVTLLFAEVETALSTAKLPATLHLLHETLRDAANLGAITTTSYGMSIQEGDRLTKEIATMRATAGALWLAALDAAHAQGGAGAALQSPFRQGDAPGWRPGFTGGAVDVDVKMMAHFLDLTIAEAQELNNVLADGSITWGQILEQTQGVQTNLSGLFTKAFGPERLPILQERLGLDPAMGGNLLKPDTINALLDREWLTATLHDAITDIGTLVGLSVEQLAGAGIAPGIWQQLSTFGGGQQAGRGWATGLEGTDLPSVAAMADLQTRLEAAGFTPGNYGKALEAFLVSVDANVVNHPLWKQFTGALQEADAAGTGIQGAVNKAIVANTTPATFYESARAITDKLTEQLKAQLKARAGTTDTEALQGIDKAIAALQDKITAYSGLMQLYATLPVEMAALTGDLTTQTAAGIDAWRVSVRSLADNVKAAQKAFDEALKGGDIVAIQQSAQALHETTMAGYQMMQKAVDQINAAIASILESATALVETQTSLAQYDISANGSFGGITTLLGSLQATAETASTAAARMWAVNQALTAIIAVLPTAVEAFGSMRTAAEWIASGPQSAGQLQAGNPAQIVQAVITAAAPFLAAQQAAINQATGPAKLGLLQQQAVDINRLGQAAIDAVNQWASAAIAGARAAAAEVIKGAQVEAARRIDVARVEADRRIDVARTEAARRQALIDAARDAALASIDAQIEATERLAAADHEMRQAQMEALQEQIAKSQEWEAAVKSMGEFIQGLKVGPLGPGNPADKLAQAQGAFSKALAAYNANPTAGGLTDLQGLAQTMLSLAEPIFSKPSPQFQTLAATTLKQLEAAQALAQAQVTDSEVLKRQLEQLQEMDKAASKYAQDSLTALREQREAVSKDFDRQTQELSKALETYIGDIETQLAAYIKQTETDLQTYITAVETATETQVDAIEKAAQDQIAGIQTGVAAALTANANAQRPLLQAQYDAATAQLAAIGETSVWQVSVKGILESIRNGIALAVGQPLAMGSERVEDGLYRLHKNEAVLPAPLAEQFRAAGGFAGIRSAQDGAGLPTDAGTIMNVVDNWATYSPGEQADIIAAYNALPSDQQRAVSNTVDYWTASREQTERVRANPRNPDLSNTGPWAPGSGDPLRDPWMESVHFSKAGKALYAQGYGPGATPGSVVQMVTPPPPPPVAPPPVVPTPAPPYVPPGPPWLHRGAGSVTASLGGGLSYGAASPEGAGGGGATTIIVKLDGKTIGEATLPTVQLDARMGKMRTIILETKAR